MTRQELIEIGQKIVAAAGSASEIDELMRVFDQHVPHPNGSNLFFYPADYHARTTGLAAYTPTVEEVVDLCLSYKSIQM